MAYRRANIRTALTALVLASAGFAPEKGEAQGIPRVQIPKSISSSPAGSNVAYQGSTGVYGQGGGSFVPPTIAPSPLTPTTPAPSTGGAAILGQPSFDPYGTAPLADSPPALFPSQGGLPYSSATPGGFGSPTGMPYCDSYGACPGMPSQAPPALFPNGIGAPAGVPALRLFQGIRFSHTYLQGEEGNEVEINDSVVALPMAFPNFAFTGQPVVVAPSFALHLWDGPSPPAMADLPGQAYSAYLDTSWRSDPNRYFGADLGVRVGVFSDFDTFNEDSIRVEGLGLVRTRLTPAVTLKVGALYLDRADIKLLPAGGILWEPNPQTRFDIFFPKPKLAQYATTLGTQDIWWYVAGEYGGGSWTVERAAGFEDRVDINDIRLILGFEWGPPYIFQQGGRVGFFEVGWVTEREIVYVQTPGQSLDLEDTIMLRAGLEY